jgi:hypothetical protein
MSAVAEIATPMVVGDITISDAGSTLVLSGPSEGKVLVALAEIERGGYRPLAPPVQVGRRWMATVARPAADAGTRDQCEVERLGHNVFIRGPSEPAVRDAFESLQLGGAVLRSIERRGGEWILLCHAPND